MPLTTVHVEQMRDLSSDSDVWRWYTEDLTDPDDLERWMTKILKQSETGSMMSFAVFSKDESRVIGSSSYGHIDWDESALEIGWTWLGKKYIGSGLNKDMKFLMLSHAFDSIGAERVELRTDEENARSRRAMEKIGAKHEGTMRNHRATQGGRRRNTVIYSIIKSEWPEIRNTIFKEY